MDDLTNSLNQLKILRMKHSKHIILKSLLEEEISNLSDLELKNKLQTIISRASCEPLLVFRGEIQNSSILGIPELLNAKLTFEESIKINRILQKALDSKYTDLCNSFKSNTNLSLPNEVTEVEKKLDCSQDSQLIGMRSKIANQQEKHFENLQKKQDLLETLSKLRLEQLPEICKDKVKEYDTLTRINALKAQLISDKTRTNIFSGEKSDICNYEDVIKGLKEQNEKFTRNVERLKDLRRLYDQSAGKKYDEILKAYVQYKTGFERKQLMINTFQQ